MEIKKIVITGGPCAGKTTAMNRIQGVFTKLGYTVLFVPETATELITGGVAPWTCGTNVEYQVCQMQLQLEKERIFTQGALTMPKDKILLVCDRGALDNKAYMTQGDFDLVLDVVGHNEVELRDSYDAVFHLVTCAKGAEQFYTLENNGARTETVEQATALDDKIIASWTGHPHLRIIDNDTDFELKMKRLLDEMTSFLGEEAPRDIKRRFLIDYPDIMHLESMPACQRVEISQTYLVAPEGEENRVRQRGVDGNYIYFQTKKRNVAENQRIRLERRLSKDEYIRLLMDADPTCRPIRKTRYCLTYKNQYFEIDIYPFWNDKAIIEIEQSDESADIVFPDFVNVIREVTDDESYKNLTLAKI